MQSKGLKKLEEAVPERLGPLPRMRFPLAASLIYLFNVFWREGAFNEGEEAERGEEAGPG